MPYKKMSETMWHCSWLCGFQHEDSDQVTKHEDEVHNAIQTMNVNELKEREESQ